MIPLGYMLKNVVPAPDWMNAPQVDFVYSLSGHVSEDFADYIPLWQHNGWWLFNDPKSLTEAAAEIAGDRTGLTMFYYEAFDQQYDGDDKTWTAIAPEPSFNTDVVAPATKTLCGYDVVTYTVNTSPECSPLSCCALASEIATNRFCLIDDFEGAKKLVESGVFDNSEPGPFRIVAVYTLHEQRSLS